MLHGADLTEAIGRADEIRAAVKSMHLTLRGAALGTVTISLGVATYPEHGADGDALINAADGAMYAAKHAGRDRVHAASCETTRDLPADQSVTNRRAGTRDETPGLQQSRGVQLTR